MTELSAADRAGVQITMARGVFDDAATTAIETLQLLSAENANLSRGLAAAEQVIALHDDDMADRDTEIKRLAAQVEAQGETIDRLEAENDRLRRRTLWGYLTGH